MRRLKLLKRPSIKSSVEVALSTSAALPNSGVAFIDNSQGASAAVIELSKSLDFVLESLDCDVEPSDQLRQQLDRLAEEAGKYSNSSLLEDVGKVWTCTQSQAELLSAACICSCVVYEPEQQPKAPGMQFYEVSRTFPSVGGTVKASAIWKVERQAPDGSLEKILVVAVRGTANVVDHMVNLNAVQRDVTNLFDLPAEPGCTSTGPIHVHAGFLNCSKALLPSVSRDLVQQISKDQNITKVVFTGHSAGGAVCSLLFLHFLCNTPKELLPIQFSLITFGAAPVTYPSLTAQLNQIWPQRQRSIGLMLAITNEYDMIPRVDALYVRSLVDLYRARYGLPPITNEPPLDSEYPILCGAANAPLSPSAHEERNRIRPLPPLEYHLIGDIVILKKLTKNSLANGLDQNSATRKEYVSKPSLKAVSVTSEEFRQLLFCDIDVHRRRSYLERSNMILEGSCRESSQGGSVQNKNTDNYIPKVPEFKVQDDDSIYEICKYYFETL